MILARHFLAFPGEHERERQPEDPQGGEISCAHDGKPVHSSLKGEKRASVVLEGNDPARERKDEIK